MDRSGSDRLESARFVSALAHEARGHLNEIGLAAGVSRRALELGQTTRACTQLDRIDERLRDVAALLDDLQDSFGPAVERTLVVGIAGLPEILDRALATVRREAEARGVAVTSCADAGRLELDVGKVRRLVALAAEGLLAVGEGGSLDVRAQALAASPGRATLELELRRRFAGASAPGSATPRTAEVVVERLARALGAALEPATLDPDGGSVVFRARVPARPVAALAREPELEAFFGTRLLVVEDDRDARAALGLLLEDWGFEVIEAASGDEGAEVGPRSGARLALLDVELPGRDGFSLREALRARDPRLPVVFLSGSERHMATRDSDTRTRYLMKPVDVAALEVALRELLDERCEQESAAPSAPVPRGLEG